LIEIYHESYDRSRRISRALVNVRGCRVGQDLTMSTFETSKITQTRIENLCVL